MQELNHQTVKQGLGIGLFEQGFYIPDIVEPVLVFGQLA